ncbi:hypothetical protein C8R46DRAFT_1241444 [Mycena filopes]|nr:hypothetical protein C8R46DRAFT_1241444 [Mycena filopes]
MDEVRSEFHDPATYFEDGNIVLSAKDTADNTVYFKLHRGILIKNSPVFEDMFAMPSPPDVQTYDGVPLAEMPGDSADALADLIAFLYEPQSITPTIEAPDFALNLLGPATLAKKYQVEWLSQLIASQLRKVWPTNLAAWRAVDASDADARARDMHGGWSPNRDDNTLPVRRFPEPVSSILLAQECDAPSILPFAFLHLLRCPLEPDPHNPRIAQYSLLPSGELRRLTLARERIGMWFAAQIRRPLWIDCSSCEAAVLRTWLRVSAAISEEGNPLSAGDVRNMQNICNSCKVNLTTDITTAMEDFVERLPVFFQLN